MSQILFAVFVFVVCDLVVDGCVFRRAFDALKGEGVDGVDENEKTKKREFHTMSTKKKPMFYDAHLL